MHKLLITTLICITCLSISVGQNKEFDRCGTDEIHMENMKNPEYAEEYQKFQELKRTISQNRSSVTTCGTPLVVPVAVHYNSPITDANTACLIEAAQKQIDQMNDDYRSCNANSSDLCNFLIACPTYFTDSNGGEVMPEDGVCIQFCLGDQNLPAGEDNIGGFAITVGDYTWPSVPGNTWDDFFNLFISDGSTAGVGNGTLGVAPLNGASNPNGNGVYVLNTVFGASNYNGCTSGGALGTDNTFNNGATLTHEAGHYFGLEHTFSDNLGDTPPQSNPNYGCPTTNTTTCTTSVGNDFSFNFMDYVDDDCMSNFSEDQANIMTTTAAAQSAWATNSISCYTGWTSGTTVFSSCQGYCVPSTSPPTALFTPANNSSNSICELGCINFIDTSIDSPNTWSWSFNVSSGDIVLDMTNSTSQNPTVCITSGAQGVISVTLTATNSNGSSTVTQTTTVIVDTCIEQCSGTSIDIPDGDTDGVSQDITVPNTGSITDINLSLDISHTYVGDLFISLSHGGSTVVLLDRPGFPASNFGCNRNNIDCTFDDQSSNGKVEDICNNTNPTYSGDYQSEGSLAVFNGMDPSGVWTIFVSDAETPDPGTLNDWCLDITTTAPTNTIPCLTMAQLIGDLTGVEDYESSDYIESVQKLLDGSSVDYDVVDYILLEAGFEVEVGVDFEAFIDGCDDGNGGVNLKGTFNSDLEH